MGKKVERYSDIIDLPHHQSVRRPYMASYNRAAQFAPFSALVGYEDMVQDTVSLQAMEKKKVLGEDDRKVLDEKLQILWKHVEESPEIKIVFYNESSVRSVIGNLKRIKEYPLQLIFEQGMQIDGEDILSIQGIIFKKYNLA